MTVYLLKNLLTTTVVLIQVAESFQGGSQFIGLGYNLLEGNPDGDIITKVGIDPGLQTTRHILRLNPETKQDLIVSDEKTSCVERQDTYIFYGAKSYQQYLLKDFATDGPGNSNILPYAFSENTVFKDIEHRTSVNHEVFRDEISVCNHGQTRYIMPPTYSSMHDITDEFASAICQLPLDYYSDVYRRFLDDWGTHVVVGVETGTKNVTRYRQSIAQIADILLKYEAGEGRVSVENYLGYDTVLHLNISDLHHHNYYRLQNGHMEGQLNVGTQSSPKPLYYKLATIATFVQNAFWNNHLMQNSDSCVGNLSYRETNIIKAIAEYPKMHGRSSIPQDPDTKIPVTWPSGTYGLYKANTGCPNSPVGWAEGYNRQDAEDTNNANDWTPGIHLAGELNHGDTTFYFCMKTAEENSEYDREWPHGNYCILKKNSCPVGFESGYIKWDDEDSGNADKHYGLLPDGSFGSDTLIYYCCRSDGPSGNRILLPIDKPFYLLRYTSSCQKVLGMTVKDEFFKMDTEDTGNSDANVGAHPYNINPGHDPVLHHCYYERQSSFSPHIIFG